MKKTKNRCPRPQKGEITAIMLEEYNEHTHTWEWYTILFDTTPLQAVKKYYKVVLDQEIKKQDVADFGDKVIAEYAQAYYITF